MIKHNTLFCGLALLGALSAAACSPSQPAESAEGAEPSESGEGAEPAETAETDEAMAGDIVEVAAENSDFSTLVAAIQAAELVETLKGEGPFTVFAPTNEAFAKLPEGTVENLLLPENRDQLVAVLTYHVVPGKMLAEDVVGSGSLTSVQGSVIPVSVTDVGVTVKGANVVATDVMATNGVIHVIDAVILPE